MYEWHVAIAIDNPSYRLDFYVLAENESDAKQEAIAQVPGTDKIKKIISVDRR